MSYFNKHDSQYFASKEFACKCCGAEDMDHLFMDTLINARIIANVPFVINSGFRCKEHNREVGGVDDSAHVKGMAADIKAITSRQRSLILSSLIDVGFTRFGIDPTFIHVDSDMTKPPCVIWLY